MFCAWCLGRGCRQGLPRNGLRVFIFSAAGCDTCDSLFGATSSTQREWLRSKSIDIERVIGRCIRGRTFRLAARRLTERRRCPKKEQHAVQSPLQNQPSPPDCCSRLLSACLPACLDAWAPDEFCSTHRTALHFRCCTPHIFHSNTPVVPPTYRYRMFRSCSSIRRTKHTTQCCCMNAARHAAPPHPGLTS